MKIRKPYWGKRKPNRNEKNNEEGFSNELKKSLTQKAVSSILWALGTFLLFVFVFIIGYTNAGDWWRKAEKVKDDLTVMKHYPVEGIVVDCDSVPIQGLKVVVQGHDVETIVTDDKGFFTAFLKLPAALDEVPVRFLDSINREVYRTLYSLDKNSVQEDQTQVYTIPEKKLHQ